MSQPLPDYYEVLQVSPHADSETVDRVFRLLAKRFHPDNGDTGDKDRFAELLEAFRVLSNPEDRASYDARYDSVRQQRWRMVDVALGGGEAGADVRLRDAILSVMYQARRQNVDQPGIGNLELEHLLGCTAEQIRFHLWYLREKGWLQRLENGLLAITVAGVDHVMERGGPARGAHELLMPAGHGAEGGNGHHGNGSATRVPL